MEDKKIMMVGKRGAGKSIYVERTMEIILLTCHECNDFTATNDAELLQHLKEEHNLDENPPLLLDLHWGMLPQNAYSKLETNLKRNNENY